MATGTGNLPNQNMDFVPLATLPAADLDKLVANIESLADGTGIGDGSVGATAIDMTTAAPAISALIDDNTEMSIISSVSPTARSISAATWTDVPGCTVDFTPMRSPRALCIATFPTKFSGIVANKYVGFGLGTDAPATYNTYLEPVGSVQRTCISVVTGLTIGSANSIRLKWKTDAGETMTIQSYDGVRLFIVEF